MSKPYVRLTELGPDGLVVDGASSIVPGIFLRMAKLEEGATAVIPARDTEWAIVVLSGKIDVELAEQRFEGVGVRADIWSGMPDSVYVGSGREVVIRSLVRGTEVAVAGGPSRAGLPPFRIRPEEVEIVTVGSDATHSSRKLCHILGKNQEGRVDRLIISERYTTGGCWAGYPPHTHGVERDGETAHDEVYHFRYNPPHGFAAQFWYDGKGAAETFMLRDRHSFLFADGYHPSVTAPGFTEYCFTILYGRNQRALIQSFDPAFKDLMAGIPGINDMISGYNTGK